MYSLDHIEDGILRGECYMYLVGVGVGGKVYSLVHIEHCILRGEYPVVTLQEEGLRSV